MEKIEQFSYGKLNYQRYQDKIKELLKNETLLQLGLQYQKITTSQYLYDIDCLKIGYGEKELFLVGGTHGSEVIGIDFLLNFIEQIPNLEEFDPNIFKLIIIPLQNPEGFDISSNTYNSIEDNSFNDLAYEYYMRYWTDSIITLTIQDWNLFLNNFKIKSIDNPKPIDANIFLKALQNFIKTNENYQKLNDKRAMPNIELFNQLVLSIKEANSFLELKIKLLACFDKMNQLIQRNDIHDEFLKLFLLIIKQSFETNNYFEEIDKHNQAKLYQIMFASDNFKGIKNKKMENDIRKMYKTYKHPLGSQIVHDATGTGINLNANTKTNPRIEAIKNNQIIYGPFVKNNITSNFPGPIGIPNLDTTNFKYEKENIALENLINKSASVDKYLACLLYHGTGGAIFYKPYQNLMNEKNYQEYLEYNENLASIYQNSTGYHKINSSDNSGYGDYLRRTYPGVLLIELSKMGGNPIGPYGDKNNIYHTFQDNLLAINELLKYFKEKTKQRRKR